MGRKSAFTGVLIAASCLVGGAALAPAGAAPKAPTAEAAGRMETFASCLSETGSGDVVVLLDESGSLKNSDPDGHRVTAAAQLIDQWVELPQRGVTLDVRVAGFSDDISWAGPWRTLDKAKAADDVAAVKAEVASFTERNKGDYTDYWAALEGASADLASRAKASSGADRCQAIVWFSDGTLDVSPTFTRGGQEVVKPYATAGSSNEQATSAAADDLCRSGGLADQIRGRDIALFGVGLQSQGTDAQTFDLMRRVSTGVSPGAVCGDRREPVPGTFETADNFDGLLLAFHKLGTPNGGLPITQQEPVCSDDACAKNTGHALALDPAVGAVDVFVTSKATDPDLVLTTPSGEQAVFPTTQPGQPTTREVGGTTVTVTPRSATASTVRLTSTTTGAPAVWRLTVVDRSEAASGSESTAVITVTSDLVPAAVIAGSRQALSGTTVEAGKPLSLAIELHRRGQTSPVTVPAGARVEASVIAPGEATPRTMEARAGAQLSRPVAVPLDGVRSGPATMRLSLDLETKAGGVTTVLRRQTVDIPFTLAPQAGTPQVPTEIDFGEIEGDGAVEARLSIAGEGCVWVSGPVTLGAMPSGVGGATVSATNGGSDRATCVQPAADAPAQLDLRLQPDSAGNGALDGTIPIGMLDSRGNELPAVTVAFRAEQAKPLEAARFWPAMIAAFLLGVGIPVGLLYLVKWRATRIAARAMSVATIPVTATEHGFVSNGTPISVQSVDLRNLAVLSPDGRALTAGVAELTARVGASPFGTGHARVEVPGHAVVTSFQRRPARKPERGVLPLAPGEAWILAHDPSGGTDSAQLIVLVPAEQTLEQTADFLRSAEADAREVFEDLRGAQPAGTSAVAGGLLDADATSDEFGSLWGTGLDDTFDQEPFTAQGAAAASSAAVTEWNIHGAAWGTNTDLEPAAAPRSQEPYPTPSGDGTVTRASEPAMTMPTMPLAVPPDPHDSHPIPDVHQPQPEPTAPAAASYTEPVHELKPEPVNTEPVRATEPEPGPAHTEPVASPEPEPARAPELEAPSWGLDDLFDLEPETTDTQNTDSNRRETP